MSALELFIVASVCYKHVINLTMLNYPVLLSHDCGITGSLETNPLSLFLMVV